MRRDLSPQRRRRSPQRRRLSPVGRKLSPNERTHSPNNRTLPVRFAAFLLMEEGDLPFIPHPRRPVLPVLSEKAYSNGQQEYPRGHHRRCHQHHRSHERQSGLQDEGCISRHDEDRRDLGVHCHPADQLPRAPAHPVAQQPRRTHCEALGELRSCPCRLQELLRAELQPVRAGRRHPQERAQEARSQVRGIDGFHKDRRQQLNFPHQIRRCRGGAARRVGAVRSLRVAIGLSVISSPHRKRCGVFVPRLRRRNCSRGRRPRPVAGQRSRSADWECGNQEIRNGKYRSV